MDIRRTRLMYVRQPFFVGILGSFFRFMGSEPKPSTQLQTPAMNILWFAVDIFDCRLVVLRTDLLQGILGTHRSSNAVRHKCLPFRQQRVVPLVNGTQIEGCFPKYIWKEAYLPWGSLKLKRSIQPWGLLLKVDPAILWAILLEDILLDSETPACTPAHMSTFQFQETYGFRPRADIFQAISQKGYQ